MMNRLPMTICTGVLTLVVLLCCLPAGIQAQAPNFNFSYPGPNVIPLGPTCSTPLVGQLGTPIVSSNIGATIVVSQFDSVASGFGLYTYLWTEDETAIVHWYVEDNQGNSAIFQFAVTFADLSPPVFDLSGVDQIINVNSIIQVPPAPMLPVLDNCTATQNLIQTFVETQPPDTCAGGTFTRTWTATDAAGNTGVFTQTINVTADILPPQIQVSPQNGSAPCSQLPTAYPAWLNTQMANFFATDPSSPVIYTNNAPAVFPPGCVAPLTVTFTATDQCSRKSTRTATFSTSDLQPPQIVKAPKDSVAACSPGGNQLAALSDWISRHARLLPFDSCSALSEQTYEMQINGNVRDSAQVVAAFLASFANGCGTQTIGGNLYDKVRAKVTVDFFVSDPCLNTAYAGKATFAAIDTLPPIIGGDTLQFEPCGGNDQQALQTWIENHGGATLSDDCSGAVWTSFLWTTSQGQSGAGVFGSGPYPQVQANNCTWYVDVTFRATDDCGNIGSYTMRWQIVDTEPPVLSGFPPVDTLWCPQPFPTVFAGSVNDNCDAAATVTHAYQFTDTTCVGNYSLVVTWTATDDCGNTSTALQTFLIRDTVPPVFNLVPPGITASCENYTMLPLPVPGIGVTATDICGALDTILISTVSDQDPDPASCGHYTFALTRIFTARDACGNTFTATQLVQVQDLQPPVFHGFTDTTAVCEIQPMMPPPTLSDNCSGVASGPTLVNTVVTAGSCPDAYTITLTWEATDVCGNTGTFSQQIMVQDTVRPTIAGIPTDVTVDCDAIPSPPEIATLTGSDNCDEDVDISFQETEIRDPDPGNCAHWTNYLIRRTWVATDNCNNTRSYTQTISVQDNTGPEIILPAAVARPNDPGICGAAILPPTPLSIFDFCTAQGMNVLLRDTALLAVASGDPNTTPVDTVFFSWPAPNMPPLTPVTGTAMLRISLDNADANGPAEYLLVYGENNHLIGQTALAPVQCGNSDTVFMVQPDLLNAWLTDGTVEITVAPFGSSNNAVNPVCTGGRVRAELSFPVALPQLPVTVTYAIDGGMAQPFPTANATVLSVGTHTIRYTATDCAGNSTTATLLLEVVDVEPPSVTSTPPPTAYVTTDDCLAEVVLPFPGIVENCSMAGYCADTTDIINVRFENDPDAGLVPKDIQLAFDCAIPNAVTGGTLRIRFKGKNANPGEFFRVFDENNNPLGITNLGQASGQCVTFYETSIPVAATAINNWAADGQIHVNLKANRDIFNFPNVIHPCVPFLNPDSTDGFSQVQAILEYDYAIVSYEVRKGAAGPVVESGALFGNQTELTLTPGNYTVKYTVSDAAGSMGMTTYPLLVRDTVRPVAQCVNKTIFTNASGEINYTLMPQEVNGGSYDNCSGTNVSLQVMPATFTCTQAGGLYPVTLTVTDTSGNTSSCAALVRVETAAFSPSYTQVCVGDTLHLMANPPATPSGNSVYTYQWSGPNGYASVAENPVIVNTLLYGSGTYMVTVTGLTGCKAIGVVQVDLINPPSQPTITAANVCAGQDIVLNTTGFGGSGVQYCWYNGTPASSVLLGCTDVPTFTVPQPAVGAHQYFVIIQGNNCTSQPSQALSVQVTPLPVATVEQSQIDICACQPLSFGTSVQGPGITYFWTGPNGYQSTVQYPPVNNCVALADSGTYYLTVYQNGCASVPVSVKVKVRPKPPTPQITGATSVCAGANVQLAVNNVTGPFQYVWIAPDFSTDTTLINAITLTNVQPPDSGAWRVRVIQQGCVSDLSPSALLQVQPFPSVAAEANTPLCQGVTLQLTASANVDNLMYQWTGPGGFGSFLQNPTPPAVSGTYVVTASSSFGCSGTDSVLVTIVPPPVITAVTSNAPLCGDGTATVTLMATVTTNHPPLTYAWNGPQFNSTDPMPVLPNSSSAINGTYNLTVTDSLGCTSQPGSTAIKINDIPPTPLISPVAPLCAGKSLTLTISNAASYTTGNYTFTWTLPNGSMVETTAPSYAVSATTLLNAGVYTVVASTDTCDSQPSPPLTVVVNPIPGIPAITASPNPVCAGSNLQLSVPLIPDAQYNWSGPMGFSASVHNPLVSQIAPAQEGVYLCTVTINGCTSEPGEGLYVNVLDRPKTPVLLPVAAVCQDQSTDTLVLQVSQGSTTPNASYTWYNGLGDPVGGPTLSPVLKITDFSGLPPGPNGYYVIATLAGCTSIPSAQVQVQLDTIPNVVPFAGTDRPACDAQPLILNATPPAAPASGRWTQISGPALTILNPSMPNSQVNGLAAGNTYGFAWTLSNGACDNYASDTVQINAVAFEPAMVVESIIDTCYATSATIAAFPGQTTLGAWSQPSGQQVLQILIGDQLSPMTTVSNLEPGNLYRFFWTLADIGCGTSTDTVIVRTLGALAFAGLDQTVCDEDSCTLLRGEPNPLPPTETGVWSSANPAITIANPASAITTACGLQVGANTFYWTVNNGICGDKARDTLLVYYELTPTVRKDTVVVPFGFKQNFSVLFNDILPLDYSVEIVDYPTNGNLELTPIQGVFNYQPDIGFAGVDYMLYQVCNLNCGDACNIAQVVFIVEQAGDCVIPTVITPNNDGVNDVFFVPCLGVDALLDNEVSIFNQWGDEVFHAQPYDNQWEGTYNGQPLPAGTYFYVVKFNGDGGTRSGFLIIQY